MAIKGTYTVKITRVIDIELTVTDATEEAIWEAIGLGWTDSDNLTREEYDKLPEPLRAQFIADRAFTTDLDDFTEITNEHTYRHTPKEQRQRNNLTPGSLLGAEAGHGTISPDTPLAPYPPKLSRL